MNIIRENMTKREIIYMNIIQEDMNVTGKDMMKLNNCYVTVWLAAAAGRLIRYAIIYLYV